MRNLNNQETSKVSGSDRQCTCALTSGSDQLLDESEKIKTSEDCGNACCMSPRNAFGYKFEDDEEHIFFREGCSKFVNYVQIMQLHEDFYGNKE